MDQAAWEQRFRDGVEAFNRGDYEGLLDLATHDAELQRAPDSPNSREVIRGREALVEFFRPDAFEDQRSELVELEFGNEAVLARILFRARGAGSGIPVEIESFVVFRIAGDRFTRMEIYPEHDEARAAARIDG